MSSIEFTRWIKYAEREPFGYPMDNYRMGVPTAAIVRAVQSTIPLPKGTPRPKAPKPSDFYPTQKGGKDVQPDLTPAQREHIEKKKRARKQQPNKPTGKKK